MQIFFRVEGMVNFGRTALVIVVSLAMMGTAEAGLIRITPQGVAVSEQLQTHPVPISRDGFRLTFHSQGRGAGSIMDPLVLILATPTDTTPGLVFTGTSNPAGLSVSTVLGGTNVWGGTWNSTNGDAGTFNAASPGNNVYSAIGLTPDGSGSSQNLSNWGGVTGLSEWYLTVYTLSFNPDLQQGNWVEFDTTGLAVNSFVVGYGCTSEGDDEQCNNAGSAQSTPFTFAGLVSIPEPGTIGLVLAGIAATACRRSIG